MDFWITIKNHPNYEINNYGEVRNKRNGRILKQRVNDHGYKDLMLDGKNERVHRLVADAFYDGDIDGMDINHIDGDKTNNFIGNLEICTRSENIRHAFKHGLKKTNLTDEYRLHGTEAMKEKLSKRVRVIETGAVYPSVNECARQTGCFTTQISQCCKGEIAQHKGLHFEFVD